MDTPYAGKTSHKDQATIQVKKLTRNVTLAHAIHFSELAKTKAWKHWPLVLAKY